VIRGPHFASEEIEPVTGQEFFEIALPGTRQIEKITSSMPANWVPRRCSVTSSEAVNEVIGEMKMVEA
jgi:hypothetical protein